VSIAPLVGSGAGGYPSRARGGAARGVARRDDRAEVLGVQRPGLPFGERFGGPRLDPDPRFAEGAVEDVGAVPGGGHPGVYDRLRRGQPQRAPGDVLADHIPVLRVGEVAGGADPVERRFAVGRGVREVVLVCHVAAVSLRGARELRIGRERALAVAFAFLIDQAQHRGAHLFDVAGRGGEVGARAGGGGEGRGCAADPGRSGRTQAGCECEQRCESGVGHGDCIDARARGREPGRAGLDTFVGATRRLGVYCSGGPRQTTYRQAPARGIGLQVGVQARRGYSASTRPRISLMISSLPPPIGPRRASRAARSTQYSLM
jgi:hypothetical protein